MTKNPVTTCVRKMHSLYAPVLSTYCGLEFFVNISFIGTPLLSMQVSKHQELSVKRYMYLRLSILKANLLMGGGRDF